MKTLAITLVLCAATTGVAAPTASAGDGTENAMERLIRQEDARLNDPRLGLVQERAAAIAARLERHVDGRDPRPDTRAEPAPNAGRGFDWPSAAVGIAATAAAFLLALGLAIVARTQRAMRV